MNLVSNQIIEKNNFLFLSEMFNKALLRPLSPIVLNRTRSQMTEATGTLDTEFVLAEEVGDKGVFTLNRPKALNGITLEMMSKIITYLSKWQNTKSMILIKANGGRAFSAGSDVRSIVQCLDSYEFRRRFVEAQYTMDYMIGDLKIPYVAFIDGITIGGGVGLSVHGRYCIATEKTLFAMPEVTIGKEIHNFGLSYKMQLQHSR